jgi:hypothetical protein
MRLTLIALLLITAIFLLGQNHPPKSGQPAILTVADADWLSGLPEAVLPEFLMHVELPDQVDNSVLPWFRPVFSQDGASCGQASAIGYNFTYEINRLRGLPADTSINQYPSHFTYNFMNGGDGYYGVNYMHSFDILKKLGTPNVYDYGGMSPGDGSVWVSGYELYRNAMTNRIRSVKKIKVGTPEGLNTLKHWLVNHLEGAETGGVAAFNAGSPYGFTQLPPETPEAGKAVITHFSGTYATHAMTIVGYNDSIRFDYNEDGQYTNDLDINDDGIVDMRDWEIGGVKFANTYGDSWADSGYSYMMYKVLADDITIGGIWNSTVNILDVKETYEPELTMKIILKHDSREKIRIAAGVVTDTSGLKPGRILHFPVFNYQGDHQYMQGGRTDEEKKTIEFGLDITPLLSYIEPGQHAKFFLEVHENDPKNEGSGEVIYFALRDYTSGVVEVACDQENVPIADDQTTRLSIIHNPDFDKANITTEELPVVTSGQPYEHQLAASGGTPEYRWDIAVPYHQQIFDADFPTINQQQLTPESPHHKIARKELDFDFPFEGESYNELFIHRDGYIMFAEDIYPWPYYNDAYLLFREVKNIAVFLFNPVMYYPGTNRDEGIWYEGNESYAAFRWKKPLSHYNNPVGNAEFAVKLFPDGTVEFFYNDIELDEEVLWYAGVSSGFDNGYKLISNANSRELPRHSTFRLIPELTPPGFTLSADGLLTGTPEPDENIYNITFRVTDDKAISSLKTLQLSDGLIFDYNIVASQGSFVQSGDLVKVDMTVKNLFPQSYSNVTATISSKDPLLEIHTGSANFGNILPGESITIENAFEMTVGLQTPDQYTFVLDVQLQSVEADWTGKMSFTSNAPELWMKDYRVADGDNQMLDPGETADIIVAIRNDGHAKASGVTGMLQSNDPFITISPPLQITYGDLQAGADEEKAFSVTVDPACPLTHRAEFNFLIETGSGTEVFNSFWLTVGQIPLLVINRAQNEQSVSEIKFILDELGMEYHYLDTIPPEPQNYEAIILCLGTFYGNTPLTFNEGLLLATYLDEGGKLYMEGTTTWYIDPQTALHPKFNTDVHTISNWQVFNALIGIDGSFAEGMMFPFTGNYNSLPCYFEPKNNAFPVLKADTGEDAFTMAAFENDMYKTIGSILEFGSYGDETAVESRKELMTNILDFFDLKHYISPVTELHETTDNQILVSAYPNPFADHVNFDIRLPQPAPVTIALYDLSGQLIRKMNHDSSISEKHHSIRWEVNSPTGKTLLPGIYIYQVSTSSATFTGKLVKL